MINPTTEKWRTVPGHPNYEMSDQGRVRNSKTGKLLDPRVTSRAKQTGVSYYIYVDAVRGHLWKAEKWYALTWPELPMIDFTDAWREAVIKFNDLPKRPPRTDRKPQANKRPCTDCGKLTTDYRCEKCWQKRSVGPNYYGGPCETYTSCLSGMER